MRDHGEVVRQLETEPRIACVVMGAGLDDTIRGDLIGVIAAGVPSPGVAKTSRSPPLPASVK